jgi:hypothetical protein
MDIEQAKSMIVNIYQDNTTIGNYFIKNDISKYSNTKVPIPRFYINGTAVGRNNNFKIEYNCINCKIISLITLNLFVRKIQHNITKCDKCKNNDSNKKKLHSIFMYKNAKLIIENSYSKLVTIRDTTTLFLIEESKNKFMCMDEQFKKSYTSRNITTDDFNNIKNNIIAFSNKKYTNIGEWVFVEYWFINNQTRFVPVLYNQREDIIEKIVNIDVICNSCMSEYRCKTLNIYKDCNKVLCKECNFCNKIFKIRNTTNINNDIVKYQSNLEYELITFCNLNNIIIQNGPKLKYKYHNKEKVYYVDFYIPVLKIIIELKDNHIWHRKQVELGIFELKNETAYKYAEENNLTFKVVFAKDFEVFKTTLIQ